MKAATSSMQLTRAVDYGVRVMIHLLGLGEIRRVSLPALAESTDTPESFLSKVLQALTRGGLLVSQRGQSGGFALSARGRDASMREVIEAVDGPIRLNVCLTSGKSCPRVSWCPAHPVWAEAQQAMLSVLESARIRDLALGSRLGDLRPLNNIEVVEKVGEAGCGQRDRCECTQSISAD
jgi:Rrf2 family protein